MRQSRDDLEIAIPLYASLLSLPLGDRYPPQELDPAELKQRTLQMLAERAVSLAEQSPLLVQVEDAHWIDPSSLEMLNQLVEITLGHPLLLIISTRPGFLPEFVNLPQVSSLLINPLRRKYTQELVKQTAGSFNLRGDFLQTIVERCEGVPLFAEELSKVVIEQLSRPKPGSGLDVSQDLSIPATLQDSLLSRLDHLSLLSRQSAQVGAAIGREFPVDLLAAVIGIDMTRMQRRCDDLVQAEVVIRRCSSQHEVLVFKHALMCDAAYQTLLQSDRVRVHARIARIIVERFPALSDASPETLAHHWSEAGEYENALTWWLTAGKRASERFANIEAVSHLNKGLALLEELPVGSDRDQWELDLRVALAPVLRVSEGARSQLTRYNSDRAVGLCALLPESPQQFAALWGKWQNAMSLKFEYGLEWTDKLERLAKELGDPGLSLQANHCQWTTLFHLGRPAEAYQHIEQGLGLYDERAHRKHADVYGGHDPRICAGSFAAHALWILGYPDRSREYMEKCREWGRRLNHKGSTLHVVELHLLQYLFRNEPEQLAVWLEELERICHENELPEYQGKLDYFQGWLQASHDKTGAGLKLMEAGLQKQRSVGSFEDIALFSERTAAALATNGRPEEGLTLIGQALQVIEAYSLRYWLAEVQRRKGELLLLLGKREQALVCFDYALEIARRQQSKALELRTAMSIARYYADAGHLSRGLNALQPVYRWFSEGLDSNDLKQARDLLQALNT